MNDQRERLHPQPQPFGTLPVWIASLILWAVLGYMVYSWLAVVL